jgi:hypothetical protein
MTGATQALLVWTLLCGVTGTASAQAGGFVERTTTGEVIESGRAPSERPRPRSARRTGSRTGAKRGNRVTRTSKEDTPGSDVTRPIDEEAQAKRPTVEPVRITGRQTSGDVKPIVFVEMDDTSILQVVLAVGRLTQINLNGKVTHVAFSDFERFRFDYKEGMIFVSPGTKDASTVDWRKVRTDLAVVLADGRQCHFELVVVDPSRPSHRVINVNAPPARREPTPEELAAREDEARRAREAYEERESRRAEELRRVREETLARASSQPLVGRARRGPRAVAVGGPVEIDGRAYVRLAITNRGKSPLPLAVTIGTRGGAAVPLEVHFPTPAVGPKETLDGLAVFSPASAPIGVALTLFVAAPGVKPVEYRFGSERR